MKTKYAGLISQLERVTEAYERALEAVKALETTTRELPDVAGVSGGVNYFGDDFEEKRAIHVISGCFAQAALDCGSDFKMEDCDEFTRVDCTLFGYRVVCLAAKGSAEEDCLLYLAAAEDKTKEIAGRLKGDSL